MSETLYDLLIKHQGLESATSIGDDELDALRQKAIQTVSSDESFLFLSGLLHRFQKIPVFSVDQNLGEPLGWTYYDTVSSELLSECLKAQIDILCVATFDNEFLLNSSTRVHAIRFGFFSQEVEILKTRLLGFHGITLHVDNLDLYQMQYVVEVCRDYKLSCILVVSTTKSLQIALETDCPYIAIWGYGSDVTSKTFSSSFALEAVRKFPKNCYPFLFAPILQTAQLNALKTAGYRAVFSG